MSNIFIIQAPKKSDLELFISNNFIAVNSVEVDSYIEPVDTKYTRNLLRTQYSLSKKFILSAFCNLVNRVEEEDLFVLYHRDLDRLYFGRFLSTYYFDDNATFFKHRASIELDNTYTVLKESLPEDLKPLFSSKSLITQVLDKKDELINFVHNLKDYHKEPIKESQSFESSLYLEKSLVSMEQLLSSPDPSVRIEVANTIARIVEIYESIKSNK